MEAESSAAAVAGASSPVPCLWTKELNKAFETALATFEASLSDRWEKVGAMVAGMGVDEVKRQFEKLEQDLSEIESGKAALPDYAKLTPSSSSDDEMASGGKKGSSGGHASGLGNGNAGSGKVPSSKSSDPERRKGIPWSEDEHRLFLLGLAKFGKGDWRSISRNFVVSRTPTQVASHAQKYFIRLNSMNNKDKRRSSIHDITNVPNDGAEALPPSPGPITGMPSPTSGGHAQWQRAGMHAGGMHDMSHQMGAPMDHSMAGPILIAPGGHVHYGQVPVMPSPMAMQHMAYTMPQSANA